MINMVITLRGLDTLSKFSAILTRKITFVTSCLLSCTLDTPSKNGFTLKRKNGANSFLLWLTPYQKGAKSIFTLLSPLKVYQFPLRKPDLRSHYQAIITLPTPSPYPATFQFKNKCKHNKIISLHKSSIIIAWLVFCSCLKEFSD